MEGGERYYQGRERERVQRGNSTKGRLRNITRNKTAVPRCKQRKQRRQSQLWFG